MELILIPLLLGILSYLIPKNILPWFALLGSALVLIHQITLLPNFDPQSTNVLWKAQEAMPLGLTFEMKWDGFSMLMLLMTSSISFLIFLSNFNRNLAKSNNFTGLAFFMQFGMNGVFLAADGMLFYIFWEFTLIPIFLILYLYGSGSSRVPLFTFFIYTFAGSLAMLASFMALGVFANDFSHQSLIQVQLDPTLSFWIMMGFFIAFAVKIPLFPFHYWQPQTYSDAPMAGTMLLSALMLKMALFGIVKWMLPTCSEVLYQSKWLLLILSLIGIIYGALVAMRQYDIKKLYAFASLSHLGIITAALALLTEAALFGASIQILNHSLLSVGMFLIADILENRLKTKDIRQMGGIAKLAPSFGFWCAIITLASVSVPFTAGFIGEFIILLELFHHNNIMGILGLSTVVLGAVFMLRAFQLSMFGFPTISTFQDLVWNELAVLLLVSIAVLLLGLFPDTVSHLVMPALQDIISSIQDSKQ